MRLAVVGFGNIARKHIEVFKVLGCEIVSACNRSQSGRTAAEMFGIPRTYIDLAQMIIQEKPDAILNCASFDKIFETTSLIIPYRIPLLVEKPAGNSVAELRHLIRLQKLYRTPIQVALNRRHYSVFQNAIADAGGIEQITSLQINWSETPKKLLFERNYTTEQVAKVLYGNSIHGLDMLTYFAGNIPNRNIVTISNGSPFRWLMSVNGVSDRGKMASFSSTWDNPAPWEFILNTQGKRYHFAPLETCKVREEGKSDLREIVPDEHDLHFKAGFWMQATCFLNLVQNPSKPNPHDLESTLPSMMLAEAFYKKLLRHGSPI